ncbi:choice-of-anchor Q domain-containing protein [Singulisphaera sp. Ch08]|uniref:Choice-of-anchor Q domain-containing protein n=1 Tax=Singulisphaera sp. Ch08 TaxID=3120278 RepID=A0AAU7CKX3_9BACT
MAHSGALGVRGLAPTGPRRAAARRRGTGLVPDFESLEGRVVLSTFTVTNANNDGVGSLRTAIDLANADPAQDTIDFASSATGTITLQSALPALSTAILLSGPGSSVLTVARSADPSTPEFRIFDVMAGAEVAISGLTISGGRVSAPGGGIANAGTLTVTHSTLSGNSADDVGRDIGSGGGIANFGTLTVTTSTFSGNSADIIGGGIANLSGTVTVTTSTFSGNSAYGGGGLFNRGMLTVINSTFSGNSAASGGGGGIANSGELTVTGSTLSGNSASYGGGGWGGGIHNASLGTLTVANSTLSGNSADAYGGGIGNLSGTVRVISSTLSGNSASGGGGIGDASGTLTVTDSTLSGNSASYGGGGISIRTGTLTVTNSTLSGNTAGGSIYTLGYGGGVYNLSGTVTATNSTLSGNSAHYGGGIYSNSGILAVTDSTLSGNSASLRGFGSGGGIFNTTFGMVTITNSTLSGNSADGTGGGISNGGPSDGGTLTVINSTLSGNSAGVGSFGGGIFNYVGSVAIITSLFVNPAGGNLAQGNAASFVSGGHNLFSDAPAVALHPTDLINTDPLLGPLADNGGPTQTMALLPGSPAIDAGLARLGVATDQRGVPRPQGAAPDIGAFELATAPFVRLTPATATLLVGASHSVTATVLDPNVRPLAGVPVTFQVTAGPNTGAAGLTSPAGGQSDANGQISFRYADTGGVGSDSIVATAMLPGGLAIASLSGTVIWTTFAVTNTNDSGPGSLRAALSIADQNPGRDTITFAPGVAGTITLLSALPDLATDIILSGPGSSTLTVARSSDPFTPLFRIFNVTAGAEVAISGLTISGGRVAFEDGGGIANAGTLTVTHSTLSGNSARGIGNGKGSAGGGIANLSGTLTVTHSILSGNSADTFGGGIYNLSGTLTVTTSTLSGNSAYGGGGIANHGTLRVTDSTLSGNSASEHGGGISNLSGAMTVTDSTLSGNSSRGGGGIANLSGTLTVTHSLLSGNSAGNSGGISNSGEMTVTDSTLSGNSARSRGGGIDNFGRLTITNSTLSGNSVGGNGLDPSFDIGTSGGGIANFGTLTVTNATLSGNSAGGRGGGIDNFGRLTITNSTLSGNSAGDGGGGIYNNIGGTLTIITSLFANSAGGNLAQWDSAPSASFLSRGHNLFSDAPAVALDPTDLINTDPLLGPLADNGGLTQTMALLPGSPAIDAGRAVSGVTADQRGVLRPQDAAPDIGAFESRGFTLVIVSGNNQGATRDSAFPIPLVVRVASAFGEPVAGGRVNFTAPTWGASANFSGNLAPIDASGQVSVLATANALVGSYAVTAQLPGGAMSLAFALENLSMQPPVEVPTVVPLTVVGVQRYGFHAQPTTLVLRFSTALDPARAQDLANYQIVTLGGHGRRSARVGRVTRVRAAVYDAATGSVTLHPAQRLDLRTTYRLTVRGSAPGGLASPTGVLLDGVGTGQPGSDFVTTISRGTLIRASRGFFNQIRYRWASLVGITGS